MILQEYLNYTRESESPESYHIWVFLSMVAAIIGKRAWIRFNYFNTYPNMYVILVSLPGRKKSTAMRIGRQLVEEAETPARITYDAITREALIGELENCFTIYEIDEKRKYGSSPLTAIASELVILLSGGGPMVEFLTDIYDSDKQWKYMIYSVEPHQILKLRFRKGNTRLRIWVRTLFTILALILSLVLLQIIFAIGLSKMLFQVASFLGVL